MDQQGLMKKIMEIQRDTSMSDAEKAIKRQELMAGKWSTKPSADDDSSSQGAGPSNADAGAQDGDNAFDDDTLKCAICMQLCERPVTAPCQHNFCLKCFQDLVTKAKKKACPSCRHEFNSKFTANPRVNTALISAIRAVKSGHKPSSAKSFVRINNDDRPDEAFTTERAQRAGRANAASGRIMVNVPNDHFGPIPASADPRGLGIRVGEFWKDRLDCRQWGAHFPHVAGIAGQSTTGAQSVVLSGGYEDDLDEGEWFLYTGSGGRDLSGNKRTNKVQSFDQTFTSMNLALKLSCEKGYPVRVVRSHKEKRSAYAPTTDQPVRYDGIYRIVKCWRRPGAQGLLMCRYLFVRCDSEPAPWSSNDTGDLPRDLDKDLPKEALQEMKSAFEKRITSMSKDPHWDWNEEKKEWGWTKAPPLSQRSGTGSGSGTSSRKKVSEHEKALKDMMCGLCKGLLTQPVSAPCGHAFCKPCLDEKFGGQAFEHDAGAATGRSLRIRKVAMPCPCCKNDLADFLRTAQVNRDMEVMVQRLQKQVDIERAAAAAADAAAEIEEEEEENEPTSPVTVGTKKQRKNTKTQSAAATSPKSPTPLKKNKSTTTPTAAAAASPRSTTTATKNNKRKVRSPLPLAATSAVQQVNGSVVGMASYGSEADRQALATATLCSEYPEFDAVLIESLMEQEEGDARAVKMALSRLRSQMEADEKKKAKQAKQQQNVEKRSPPVSPRSGGGARVNVLGSAAKRAKVASP